MVDLTILILKIYKINKKLKNRNSIIIIIIDEACMLYDISS
jgi:hypothetical protein